MLMVANVFSQLLSVCLDPLPLQIFGWLMKLTGPGVTENPHDVQFTLGRWFLPLWTLAW